MQTGWGGDVTPRGLSSSGRPFDKIRNLRWPCNVKGGGSRRAPVAQGAGLSPAPAESVQPPTGLPIPRGSALAPTEAGDLTGSELGWMLQACKMEGFPLVPPVSIGTPPPAQPVALGRPPAFLPARRLPSWFAISGKLVFPPWSSWPESQRGGHRVVRAWPGGLRPGPRWGCDRWGLNGYL